MSGYSLLRLVSVLVTIGIVALFNVPIAADQSPAWKSVIFSVSFAHYFLALGYSRRHLARVHEGMEADWRVAVSVGALTFFGMALFLTNFPLLYYFAFHHVFTEVYLSSGRLALRESVAARRYFALSLTLNLLIYATLLRGFPELSSVPKPLLATSLVIAVIAFFAFVLSLRHSLSRRKLVDACLMEVVGLGFVIFSLWYEILFLWIICYHVVFWFFYPMSGMLARSPRRLGNYVAANMLMAGGFLALSPMGVFAYPLEGSFFQVQFLFWSYFHITSSMALSDSNPRWLMGLFRAGGWRLRSAA